MVVYKNTKRKGAISIAEAINYFIEHNYSVFIPVADCDKYDIIIDSGKIQKVQCKYTSDKSNLESFAVRLYTFGGYREKTYRTLYKNGDFDLLFIYCSNGNKFLIPEKEIIGKSEISVSAKKKSPWIKYLIK